jgi:glutamate-1-semialdehyde 2,1-aminomutase
MRAATGRDVLIKIEGDYHGHHDAVMVSVTPEPDAMGPREHPRSVAATLGLPASALDLMKVVPYNDLEALERLLVEYEGQVAGLIMEPAIMNIGVIPPEPGYLEGVRELVHEHGAMLTFDEVKTGLTIAWGGGVEAFGVVPDFVCLAKALGGGVTCGAIGGTDDAMAQVITGEVGQFGTFNGNPIAVAAIKATLTEVLTRDAYRVFDELNDVLVQGLSNAISKYELPAYVAAIGAKGSVMYSSTPIREYRDTVGIDERITYLAWLFQQNRGVFKSPWTKQETWTLSVAHTTEQAHRYVDNFEEFAAAVRETS